MLNPIRSGSSFVAWWAFALLVGGCGSDGRPGSGRAPDVGRDLSGQRDVAETDTDGDPTPLDASTPAGAAFGEPCDGDGDCESRLCVQLPGFEEGFCSAFCLDDSGCLEDDWECLFLVGTEGDVLRACVPTDLCLDEDDDGYGIGSSCDGADCDDTDPGAFLGADEFCNGVDDDCDGVIDDYPVDASQSCTTPLPGICAEGLTQCAAGLFECRPIRSVSPEVCNGEDDDCDGTVDEAEEGGPIAERCYPAAEDTEGVGECAAGTRVCSEGRFGQCEGLVFPLSDEFCNGVDDDCDGSVDEGSAGGVLSEVCYPGESSTEGVGMCRGGVRTCSD